MMNSLNAGGKLLDCSTPRVMGILNVTPDSFYDGGKLSDEKSLLKQAESMLEEGASILDIGAQSTRPKSELIDAETEWQRLSVPLASLRKTFPQAIISADTFHSSVALYAVNDGADMINDISGGALDAGMFQTLSRLHVPYVLTHLQGTPQTMQDNVSYNHVTRDVMDFFVPKINDLTLLGQHDIILDPGFGFGKNLEHNYRLLSDLSLFRMFERLILVGVSRKSMVNKVIGTKPADALNGTTVLHTIALQNGANILRVHDVKEAIQTIQLVNSINSYS